MRFHETRLNCCKSALHFEKDCDENHYLFIFFDRKSMKKCGQMSSISCQNLKSHGALKLDFEIERVKSPLHRAENRLNSSILSFHWCKLPVSIDIPTLTQILHTIMKVCLKKEIALKWWKRHFKFNIFKSLSCSCNEQLINGQTKGEFKQMHKLETLKCCIPS